MDVYIISKIHAPGYIHCLCHMAMCHMEIVTLEIQHGET